jgi:phosphoribosyl-AMP cyclohydrolase
VDESRGARLTARTGEAHYWSRARPQAVAQGRQSGHVQAVKDIRLDCDNDSILVIVEQLGGIACHTGRESCFFLRLENERWETVDPVLKDPEAIYGPG